MIESAPEGRLPPQSLEAEQAVLGAVLIAPDVLPGVLERLGPDDFYRPAHRHIFAAVCGVHEAGQPIDAITVIGQLQNTGRLADAGGVEYVLSLARSVPTAVNASHHADIVAEQALLRRLIGIGTEMAAGGYAGTTRAVDLLDSAERRVLELAQARGGKGFIPISELLTDAYARIEHLYNNKDNLTGIASGYPELDRMTSGFQRSDLIIVAARPSVGKTAFALNIAQNVAVRFNQTVAVFSLEMSKEQLVQRMISAESNLDASVMRSGQLTDEDWEKLAMGIASLSEAPLYIDDSAGVNLSEMRARARKLQMDRGLGLIVVDYLQLIHGRGRSDNRQQEISEISRNLKGLARDLDVPVIALSQLSRSVEQRQDKRPLLSDIRESGSIEQDADVVAFLYRDDYYDPETEKKNIVEVIIAKQRNGPTGKLELVFLKNFNKFVSLERHAH
jgi:replicative DNA helicase